MKRFVVGLMVVIMVTFCLTGCGNMSMGMGNYTFRHIHFSDAVNSHCATVNKWHDDERGIEVKTEEYGPMFLSEGSYILIENGDNCPYCD